MEPDHKKNIQFVKDKERKKNEIKESYVVRGTEREKKNN